MLTDQQRAEHKQRVLAGLGQIENWFERAVHAEFLALLGEISEEQARDVRDGCVRQASDEWAA